MATNMKMATAVQILCVIAYRKQTSTTALDIARSLDTNPVVVRRMLKDMESHGLVTLKAGKSGGVKLAAAPEDINLAWVYRSVEEDKSVFVLRGRGNPLCPVDNHMHALLTPVFDSVAAAVEASLRETTLASLASHFFSTNSHLTSLE